MKAFITGSGSCVPERVVTNEELAANLGLTSEQILRSSGIPRRRWVEPGTTTSSLASSALDLALENSGLDAHEIDYLLFGTMTPDRFIPGTGIRDRFASRNADSANGAPLRKFSTGVADLSKSNECFPAELKFGGAE